MRASRSWLRGQRMYGSSWDFDPICRVGQDQEHHMRPQTCCHKPTHTSFDDQAYFELAAMHCLQRIFCAVSPAPYPMHPRRVIPFCQHLRTLQPKATNDPEYVFTPKPSCLSCCPNEESTSQTAARVSLEDQESVKLDEWDIIRDASSSALLETVSCSNPTYYIT